MLLQIKLVFVFDGRRRRSYTFYRHKEMSFFKKNRKTGFLNVCGSRSKSL